MIEVEAGLASFIADSDYPSIAIVSCCSDTFPTMLGSLPLSKCSLVTTLCRFLRGQGENVLVRLSACSVRLCPFPFALSHTALQTMCSMAHWQAHSYTK